MEMTGALVDPARPRQEWWLRRDRAGVCWVRSGRTGSIR